MNCIVCGQPLQTVPFFNNNQDDKFAPSIPYCPNKSCANHGLLCVAFRSDSPVKDSMKFEEKVEVKIETPDEEKKDDNKSEDKGL